MQQPDILVQSMIRERIRMCTLPVKLLLGHFDLPRRTIIVVLQLRCGLGFRDALLALGGWCHGC